MSFQRPPAVPAKVQSNRAWEPGVWRRFPYLGVGALLGASLCAVAAAIILAVSDGQPIDDWKIRGITVQPTVLIAIFTALANAFVRFAFSEGVTIAWWTRALKGRSLHDLHRYWDQGHSFIPVLVSGRHFNPIALASFLVTIILIDGPLLQRASTVTTLGRVEDLNITIPVSPGPFIKGATGIFAARERYSQPSLYDSVFSEALQQYNNRSDLIVPDLSCDGTCETTIAAAGFDVSCRESSLPYRLVTVAEYLACRGNGNDNGTCNDTTFSVEGLRIDISYNSEKVLPNLLPQHIDILARYKTTTGFQGTLVQKECTLQEAVVRYPIRIVNNTISLLPAPPGNSTEQIVQRSSESSGMGAGWPATCGGIWLALSERFDTIANVSISPPFYTARVNGSAAKTYISESGVLAGENMTWRDPMPDILGMAREISLRAAIATTFRQPELSRAFSPTANYGDIVGMNTTNRTLSQIVPATRSYSETVYQSHFNFLAGGLVIIFLAVFGVLPVFLGWWHLGRQVTLSPIELAKAFNAPLLDDTHSNATARELIETVGTKHVQYGVSNHVWVGQAGDRRKGWNETAPESTKLLVGHVEMDIGMQRRRLGIMGSEYAEVPRQGEIFL